MIWKLLIYSVIIAEAWILFISFLWKSQKGQRCRYPFKEWITLNIIPFKDFFQPTISIIAIIIALYVLRKDIDRDNESSLRFSQSVGLEKEQHDEIMKVYAEQRELLLKYNQSADSMLTQLEIQAKIAKLQYENQVILTQPVIVIDYTVHDTLKTSFNYENENWIMPEVKLRSFNNGNRTAKDFKLAVTFVAPDRRTIQELKGETESFLCSKCLNFNKFYPLIALVDKDLFFIIVDFQYTDELNLKYKQKQRYYIKCIIDKNYFYTIGVMQDKQIEDLKSIMDNPSKKIIATESMLEYIVKTYFIR